jgi:3-phosphoshikimate 1-carboxyvinyltransferase
VEISGLDSQPVSGILIATSFLKDPSEIFVKNPHEQPWIDLTLDWLNRFGISIRHQNYRHYVVPGGLKIQSFSTTIPGDFSTAAFPIVASMITGKSLVLTHLPYDDSQGDKELISLLREKGALIDWEGDRITVHGGLFEGGTIDVNPFIDAVPILATLACFGKSPTTLVNAFPARFKESDRLAAIQEELSKMGARIESTKDTLTIYPSTLQGATLYSHRDHRIAMALCIAALKGKGSSEIHETGCISKSYPQFQKDLQELGHDIRSSSFDTLLVSEYGK